MSPSASGVSTPEGAAAHRRFCAGVTRTVTRVEETSPTWATTVTSSVTFTCSVAVPEAEPRADSVTGVPPGAVGVTTTVTGWPGNSPFNRRAAFFPTGTAGGALTLGYAGTS